MSWISDLWEDYHKNGIIPNLWKGFTGQMSAEIQSEEALKQQQDQFEAEMAWQQDKYAQDLDFANRQLDWQKDVADKNFGLQEKQFQYQKDLNEIQMQREDNAIQRQVADLTKAGFSPLAAIGGSGSAAGSLNAGNAPQYDPSGVSAAAGQYLDLARQYASLHQELNSKNADAKLGARMALAQMKADLNFKGQNMATQYFNAAVNAKNKKLQNESLAEDIQTKKYANDYYAQHGYQHVTLATVLSDFLNNEDVKKASAQFTQLLSSGLNNLANAINGVRNGDYTVTHVLGSGFKQVASFLAGNKGDNFSFGKEENNSMLNELPSDDKQFALDWCKKNGKSINDLTLWDWMDLAEAQAKSKKK